MARSKLAQQVRFLLSKKSPLTAAEKKTLKRELKSGAVKVRKKRGKKRS